MIFIKDFTFSQYFSILEILNADQYEFDTHPKTGKLVRKKNPIAKEKRTEDFLFELHREIVKQMTNLSVEYIEDDTFVLLCWDLISAKLDEINILISFEGLEDVTEAFDLNGSKLAYLDFDKWTFNKWVTLENAMKGTSKQGENGQIEILEHGAKFVLPICFGEWTDKMEDFADKYNFFNNQLFAKDVALVFAKINNRINALKSAHYPMYSNEQSEGAGRNYKSHVDMFGWLETLRALGKEGVFGDYLQLKASPLLEVLEYLNTSVSAEIAKEKDFEIANKVKK
mgnify:CR=1 FL=1